MMVRGRRTKERMGWERWPILREPNALKRSFCSCYHLSKQKARPSPELVVVVGAGGGLWSIITMGKT